MWEKNAPGKPSNKWNGMTQLINTFNFFLIGDKAFANEMIHKFINSNVEE